MVAAQAAGGAPYTPPAAAPDDDEPEQKGTERIPEHQAELYRLAALRASQTNNPVVGAPDSRPGLVTAMLPGDLPLPPSPTWRAATGGTHKMPLPGQRWPSIEEAEKPTRVMAWKKDHAESRRSLVVGVAAGLAITLIVVATVALARCGPDEGAAPRPGSSAAP
jgi:hypothetical protein